MKTLHLFITSIFLLSSVLSFTQSNLTSSRRQSSEIHIYKISKEDLRKVHLKEGSFDEGMLKTLVVKYKLGEKTPFLSRGNYVEVKAVENQLNYTELIIDDLYAKVIPSERFTICLYDSLGNIIRDAEVAKGSTKLKFDKLTQVYTTDKVKDKQIIEINHKGVYHYLEIEDSQYYNRHNNIFQSTWGKLKWRWSKLKNGVKYIFYPSDRPIKDKYTGFIVFNKPKYKPGETVKMKAYLSERNGKRYNKPVDIRLYEGYFPTYSIDTVLTRLTPYQPGMYSYEFKLTDEMDLMLDKNYYISFNDKNGDNIRSSFRYEDYELKSISYSLKSDKKEFAIGDSIKLDAKVTDENDMAVYDGRIEVLVMPENLDQNKMKTMRSFFIPDTLWNHTIDMFGMSEKNIIIPDSIFPLDIDVRFRVKTTYLSSDNEKHTQSLSLTKLNKKHVIDFSLDKGLLTIKELYLGKSQPVMANITISGENDECLYNDSATLPHVIAIPWNAGDIKVKTKNTEDFYFSDEAPKDQLGYKFYRNNDSIYLKVNNPANIPFWYTIRKTKREIAKGYTNQLNYVIRDTGEDGYSMQISYLFGGESKSIESKLPFVQKNITMDVTTPTTVYPGQKANVQVAVSDKDGNPIKGVDITAYSFTSKFKNYSMPNIPIGGKARYAKQFRNTRYKMEDDYYSNEKSKMTWNKWAATMSLDTIEYYKFLYPDTYYVYKEATTDTTTRISPFVVIDGEVQGVHMLWIDERLYYAKQAEHLDIYSFKIKPGKHSLRFRTHNREVIAQNFIIEKGKKHIMSFNGEKSYSKIPYSNSKQVPFVLISRLLDKEQRGYMSDKEEAELSSQLITVNNNFGKIKLPNIYQTIEIPGYLITGNTFYYLNHTSRTTYNNTLRTNLNNPILAGPFPQRSLMNGLSDIASVYADDRRLANVEIEGGNLYTLYPNYQKIKQWDKSLINRTLSAFKPVVNFNQQPLSKDQIDNQVKAKITNIMRSASGFVDNKPYKEGFKVDGFHLSLVLGQDSKNTRIEPTLIFIEPREEEDRKDYQLYYGGTRSFKSLPTEELLIHLVFNDSTSYSYPLKLYKGGKTYLKLDSICYDKNKKIAQIAYQLFNRGVWKNYAKNPYVSSPIIEDSLISSPIFNEGKFNQLNKNRKVITGTVKDSGEPLIGVAVKIKGTDKVAVTDFDGKFEIEEYDSVTLEFLYLGYKTKEIEAYSGYDYDIVLKEDESRLDEVVVIGYGSVRRSDLTGSIATIRDESVGFLDNGILQGRIAGVMIRGTSSVSAEANPLIIVNGLPFDGSMESLDPSTILSLNILKDAAATSIYGARGANGVIMIETNAFTSTKATDDNNVANEGQGNTMRRNFHDDAFWQPQLMTDEKGIVNFEVTYPDDITNWNAYFIALGGKKQSDTKRMNIRSFKALSARLSTPRFAVRGDSLNAVGKIANHFGDSLQLTRTIELDSNKQTSKINIGNSHVDFIPLNAINGDSLTLAYSLQMKNGYFDGEERSFPIIEQGLLQTYGDFKVINDSSVHTLNLNPALGEVTIHAEASGLELFLREIENIDRYPYMCNEQMASKIKALLAKKYIYKQQGKEFKEDKKINSLIRDINKNKNKEGFWGWWNKSTSVMWISKHIINALLDAEEAGYKIEMDKQALALAFETELKNSLSSLPLVVDRKPSFAKGELLDRLILLKRLDASIDYKAYLYEIDSQLESREVKDKLKMMLIMSSIDELQNSIKIDSIMSYSGKTILGSLYWGNGKQNNPDFRYFYRPYETNTENTLFAYQILKNMGGHDKELTSIRNYFFEQRQNNTWSNIYESSRIVQAIMPDMLSEGDKYSNVVMDINGAKVKEFPYTTTLEPTAKVEVRKTGTMPLFVTAYQREWNKTPIKEESKGFKVSTTFKMNNDSIANLQEGKSTMLQATLSVAGDAEYVQIEIPIPAGCSYESKYKGSYWKESHREHYKEKVVIFCNKLTKGEHIFNVELLPRYTGKYTLNPAKVELMYFPTFYGNEEVKTTLIK